MSLRNLEKEFPEFINKDSLTQKVGGTVKEGFEKVHTYSSTSKFTRYVFF
jgi:NAD-dependent DNA ligase